MKKIPFIFLLLFAFLAVHSTDSFAAKTKRSKKQVKSSKLAKKAKKTKRGWPKAKKKKSKATSPEYIPPPTPVPEIDSDYGSEYPIDIPVSQNIYSPINVSAGTNFGFNYLFTVMHFELALFRNWVVGVVPLYSSSTLGSTTANAIGVYGTAAYYPKSYFDGGVIQFGVGAVSISATSGGVSERKSSFVVNAVGGWRITLMPHLNVCLAAGFQYATDPGLTLVDINFKGVRPLFTVDVGYNF